MSPQNKRPLVFYHGKCPDGFGAALAAWLVLGDSADYVGCAYTDAAPAEVDGRDVYIVDFSFSLEIMEALGRKAKSLTLLDHHKSAAKNLSHFKPQCCGKIHFDLGHSGAVLAWEHFHPGKPLPYFFKAIESRDLWHWDVPGDRAFLAWLDALPMEFEAWKALLDKGPEELEQVIAGGEAMSLKFNSLVRSIATDAVPVRIAGIDGLMVNATPDFASDVGNALATKSGTFGLVWRLLPNGRVKCSLRSNAPYEVLPIALQFGGGGHSQSASFTLPQERLLDVARGVLDPTGT